MTFAVSLSAPKGTVPSGASDLSVRNATALRLLSLTAQSQTISFAKGVAERFPDLGSALESVAEELAYAQKNVRSGNVIDGRAMEPLLAAIEANRDLFPPGEFSIKLEWPDGASVEAIIPAMPEVRVTSTSISAVFRSTPHAAEGSIGSASARASYLEWQ
jgi:hypothetical protein